jgi:hypothetical protein
MPLFSHIFFYNVHPFIIRALLSCAPFLKASFFRTLFLILKNFVKTPSSYVEAPFFELNLPIVKKFTL